VAAHRYWRILPVTLDGYGIATTIAVIQMRETVDGPNLSITGNGTASAQSSNASYPAANAFRGDVYLPPTYDGWWSSPTGLNWIMWDFGDGAAYSINYLTLWSGSSYPIPTSFKLQHSDDGTTWTDQGDGTAGSALSTQFTFAMVRGEASVSISPPAPILAAYAGADASVTAPSPSLFAATGANSQTLTAPSPRLVLQAHDSTGEQAANLTAPSPTLTFYTGANARLTAPKPTLTATGTVTRMATASLTAPKPTLQAAGTVTKLATATLSAPSPNLVGYGGAVCSVSVTGKPTLTATGTTGGVATVAVTAPLFELTSTATMQNHGSANLIAPSPRMGQTIQAWLAAPSARLTAIGTAVVTATYEAYAVNLGHRPRVTNQEIPVNEVTHYTNFPFTHVVRYQNSYYGANSTGLYLLEGTTDNGTAIPWAVKTAMDDFKTPTKKTVASAYFGGRFGPASTVQLHAGEQAPNTYSFSTPRDALAQNHRQVFGKGVRERYFALGASGTGACEIDTIELETHNMTRRI